MTSRVPSRDEIAARAYAIYQARGGTDGLDEDDWHQAEAELAIESAHAPLDAGPNVPVDSGGRGERASEVMPDVDETAPGEQPVGDPA